MVKKSRTYIASPPGAAIREQLEQRGMSQKEFAARMGLSEKHVSRLINGDVLLTTEVALRLESVLGIRAGFWLRLESIYREKLGRINEENSMEEDIRLAGEFPYQQMADFQWVPEAKKASEKVRELRKYFGVARLTLLGDSQINRIACRRLAITDKGDLALMAWAQQARVRARNMDVKPVDLRKLESFLPEIRKLTREGPERFCPKLTEMLGECGIAIVYLPHLAGSFLQGATMKDGSKIVLGITARGKDADKFWFSLFHELGHIVLGHVEKPEEITGAEEKKADAWARDQLIMRKDWDKFLSAGDYTKGAVLLFSEEIDIAPGIVVGRMQNDGIIPCNALNGLKEHTQIPAS